MDATTGFAAALASTVFFGSFGVPIKSQAIVKAQVDPVIFQCYKTAACFCSCWLALLFVEFKFTAGLERDSTLARSDVYDIRLDLRTMRFDVCVSCSFTSRGLRPAETVRTATATRLNKENPRVCLSARAPLQPVVGGGGICHLGG